MHIQSIRSLLPVVKIAGGLAVRAQSRKRIARSIKSDGSFVTEVDRQVEDFLVEHIRQLFPGAGILSEESLFVHQAEDEPLFVLDPIDGTDVFSQGMPGWCISIGLLDRNYLPVAGIVYSPALKLLFFADVHKPATLNRKSIQPPAPREGITNNTNLMVPASVHKQLDLSAFPGKIRSIGSAALHICFPLAYPGVFAAIETRGAHIWDIAGAHAINRSLGAALTGIEGQEIDYRLLLDGKAIGMTILAGPAERIQQIKPLLRKIEQPT